MWGLGDQMFAEGSFVGSGGLSIFALGYRDFRRIVCQKQAM